MVADHLLLLHMAAFLMQGAYTRLDNPSIGCVPSVIQTSVSLHFDDAVHVPMMLPNR